MTSFFCVTVRFLQSTCHGAGTGRAGVAPFPPPRVSIVNGRGGRPLERTRAYRACAPALRWLEKQPPPLIIAPRAKPSGVKYRLYVPDNVGDKVAGSWSRGGEASIADYRTEKDVRPTHVPDDAGDLHYLWPCSGPQHDADRHTSVLVGAARSITHLGWGIDMVAGNACLLTDAETNKLIGERWHPTGDEAGTALRVPVAGTLSALMDKHEAFLNRLRRMVFSRSRPSRCTTPSATGDPAIRANSILPRLACSGLMPAAFASSTQRVAGSQSRRCCDMQRAQRK